ncbi:MAG: DASS family sodium-coupled anion symporter [Duodenibacillus sp.]|nr:DASS family sodium-coupled anion symporter [Duodenibacillus sp.]
MRLPVLNTALCAKWTAVFAVGAAVACLPSPHGLQPQTMTLLAVFAAAVVGFILQPMPMGPIAFLSLTVCALFGIIPTKVLLSGFGASATWMVVCAFFISRAFIKTGLGRRIAFVIIRAIGKNAVSLGYSICLAELIVSPAMPAGAARGGGLFYPIVRSICSALDSEPGPTGDRIGRYLMQVGFTANGVTCGLFLTSMAANTLCIGLAAGALGVELTWTRWAAASIVPGLICLASVPVVLFYLSRPVLTALPNAQKHADEELKRMGPLTHAETMLLGVFGMCLLLWAAGSFFGIGSTAVAMLAVAILLVTGALSWEDILSEKGAWDALFWVSALTVLSAALADSGLIRWVADLVAQTLTASHFDWTVSFIILSLIYIYGHYFFASVMAHISAMYAAFIAVAVACGAPPLFAAVVLGIFSSVSSPLTHYSNASAPVFFGAGYVPQTEWWRNGLITTTIFTVIWMTVGPLWWRVIGLL